MNYTENNDEVVGRNLCVVRMHALMSVIFCFANFFLLPIIIWKREIKFQYGLKYFVCHRLAMI